MNTPVLAISGPRDGPARAVEALQEERGVLMRLYWLGLFSALMSRVFLTYLIFTASIQASKQCHCPHFRLNVFPENLALRHSYGLVPLLDL